MKKIMTVLLVFVPIVSMADMNLDIRNQMLDSEIARYTKTRDEKYEVLKQCEKSTQGFKIAGITTLVATGVGVVANVKLSQKLNGTSGSGGKTSNVPGMASDLRSQSDKDCDNLKKLQEKGLATQEEVNEACS